ncbi:HPr kinase/phosphorylase [Acidiphilium sp. C61]|jgi:HPr kinase/phosphorylase|uniref:HPr kinase/phosphorylase n=1 Tax=Acidiphilium sp. C61 TaxID=1671485 RepID=UPI00157B8DCD|nr:aldolase [Acidiphilium sp. C61]
MILYGSCAALDDDGVLLLGPSGSGKSDLLLRLLDRGFSLVSDDQVSIEGEFASAPPSLLGIIELRGLGLFKVPATRIARLRLAVQLGNEQDRLPFPKRNAELNVPEIFIDPRLDSAPIKVQWALDTIAGRREQVCGCFVS